MQINLAPPSFCARKIIGRLFTIKMQRADGLQFQSVLMLVQLGLPRRRQGSRSPLAQHSLRGLGGGDVNIIEKYPDGPPAHWALAAWRSDEITGLYFILTSRDPTILSLTNCPKPHDICLGDGS